MAKKTISQRQFIKGYVPDQAVQANSIDDREANATAYQRKRMGIQLGAGLEARPGMAGKQSRTVGQAGTLKKRGK